MRFLLQILIVFAGMLMASNSYALTLNETHSNVTCFGDNDGSIDITPNGGTAPFSYVWNDANMQQNRTGLVAGTYSVTATDGLGATATASINISQPTNISINSTSTQPICNGGSDGTITITSVVGGAAPYGFVWNDGTAIQNRTGLSAGTYSVTATSFTGCSASSTIILGEPTAITVTLNPISLTCFGGTNGAINTTVTGGTPAYSYLWSDGGLTKNRTGLSSTTYQVTVTDLKGCTATAPSPVLVPQPIQLTATAIPSDLACTGGPTGSVTTSISGGTPPYSYWWGSGVVAPNRVNVNSGTYTVTVTDANGCSATASATIPPYVALSASTALTNNVCFGGKTGAINLTVNNGWTPYVYLWSNDSTTQDLSGLSASSHSVTVTDDHGCTITKSATITQPPFPIVINSTITDVLCYSASTGAINLNVVNGASPYSYNWGGGITTQNRTALAAGNYSVTVTDNANCSSSIALTVGQPVQLIAVATPTDVTCFGGTNGQVNLNANGGWAPYTFSWNNTATTEDLPAVAAGNYSVLVTDNRSCTATASATVSQPTAVSASIVSGAVTCNGGNNGWINLTPSGGTSPYTFDWGGGITTANRTGLVAGTYTVTVTDNAGCTFSNSTIISQPAALALSSTVTGASCNGGNNGAITLNISGGTSPYSFNWNDGPATQNRSGLVTGTYIVTATDFAACSATATINVGEATSLVVTSSQTDVSCFGGNNAAINLNVTGGTAPYIFKWSDSITTKNRASLSAGNYSLTTSDNAGCSTTNVYTITQPAIISVATTIQDVSCFGGNNGGVQVTVSGGTPGYSYNWNGDITTQNRTGLISGLYSLTVTDNALCSSVNIVSVTQPVALSVTSSISNVSCNTGTNGSISLTVTGGTTPYTYNWGTSATSTSISNLVAGTYPVTVSDAHSCISTQSYNVTEPTALQLSLTKTDIACFSQPSGRIDAHITGGTAPYTFNWDNGISTQNISGMSPGTYTVTATDNLGCKATESESITQPSQMSTAIQSIINPSCHGMQDGRIDIMVNGGTSPYTYNWSNGSTARIITNAAGGNNSVSITDANNCTSQTSINLTQPAAINIAITATDITCNGAADGTISSYASGGKGGFTYLWNTNATTKKLNNLTADTYSLTVKDLSNCTASASFVISEPTAIQISETHTSVACNGGATGTIDVTATGGTGTLSFLWDDSATTDQRTNLGHGSYSVTVSDANSCSKEQTITISQTSSISVTESHTDYACTSKMGTANISVTGGVPPYNYLWNDGITIKDRGNLLSGNYNVTITDAASCSAQKGVDIAAIPLVTATVAKTDIACSGAATGALNVSLSGGVPGYSYKWNTGAHTSSLTNLTAGTYNVTVTDGNGCTCTRNETISTGAAIQIAETVTNATCHGSNNGAIDISLSGGTAPYTYQWNTNAASQNLANITGGNYSVTVADANNCSSVKSITVMQPSAFDMQSTINPAGCNGQNSGSISVVATGGTDPYAYSWDNQQTGTGIDQLSAGNYTLTLTDNNQCSVQTNFVVPIAQPVTVEGNAHNTSCPSVDNGRIELTVSGGAPDYAFTWSNGQTTRNLQNLPQGNYSVTVVDAQGCQSTADYTLTYDYDLTINASASTEIIKGQTAELSVTATNDHRNKYTWWPFASVVCNECRDTKAYPQESTTYTVDVVDMNGCRASDSVRVDVRQLADKIFLPNAFTPNADGNNDYLELYGDRSDVRQMTFALFNRLGEKVYETDDQNFQWDGSFRGETSPTGVYRYAMRLVFADGTGKEIQGSVTVLR